MMIIILIIIINKQWSDEFKLYNNIMFTRLRTMDAYKIIGSTTAWDLGPALTDLSKMNSF